MIPNGSFVRFVFNWNIIALQCCVSLCYTATWISYVVLWLLCLAGLSSTPRTAACQFSSSFSISQSLLIFTTIQSVMLSNHLILCSPSSLPALNLSQHQRLFQWDGSSHQVAKILELQLQHQSFQRILGLISFRMDWSDLLAVQGTLKSLLQHHSSKASILCHSAFFMVQLSHQYMTTGKTTAWTTQTFVS